MATRALRILFIGNSFVARHDVPGQVAALAATAGRRVEPTTITAGGASLRRHLNSGAIGKVAAATRFDRCVLQEQSTLPIRNAARFHANVRDVVSVLTAATPSRGRAPRILLYQTWARQADPDDQARLTAAVAAVAADLALTIAPVGQAWQRVLAGADRASAPGAIGLYDRDGRHASLAGAFLAAAVIAMAIFPADRCRLAVPDVPGLDRAVATRLLGEARGLMRRRAPA